MNTIQTVLTAIGPYVAVMIPYVITWIAFRNHDWNHR